MYEYKVIQNWLCWTAADKARKMEQWLNKLTAEGWEFVAQESVFFWGTDVGFYLIFRRPSADNKSIKQ
jgi:Domain of unknown function (DUF4177)